MGTSAENIACNICGGVTFRSFNGRQNAACATCGSLERMRLFYMFLQEQDIGPKSRILHIAPERTIYKYLIDQVSEQNYICADIDLDRYSFTHEIRYIDLTNLNDWDSDQFDFIFHMHVLEHIPCNYTYCLFHLHRMLRKTGAHICSIPIMSGRYDETFQDIGNEERKRRFGQFDHVRRFGADDIQTHLGKVLNIPSCYDVTNRFGKKALFEANIPHNICEKYTPSSVLLLKKNDYLLAPWEK